jgi:hypothetical protein
MSDLEDFLRFFSTKGVECHLCHAGITVGGVVFVFGGGGTFMFYGQRVQYAGTRGVYKASSSGRVERNRSLASEAETATDLSNFKSFFTEKGVDFWLDTTSMTTPAVCVGPVVFMFDDAGRFLTYSVRRRTKPDLFRPDGDLLPG